MGLTKATYSLINGAALNVLDFGADPTGTDDSLAAIQDAIDSAGDNVQIYFPSGTYKVTGSIDLTQCEGVHLVGAGQLATEIFSTANEPVIKIAGSSTAVTNSTGVQSMTIRGSGQANSLAHGVSFAWTNSCYLQDLVFFSCRHAMNIVHNWQTNISNVRVYGAGTDQTYIGMYMDATTLTDIDNAVVAYNVNIQGTSQYGFRIINGHGSKFTSCEAGGSPMVHAWYIGDPPSGTVKCQWICLTNCLGDSTSGSVWLFRRGTATELSQMQLDNCWAGNGDHGFFVDAARNIIFGNCQAIGNTNSGVTLNQCEQIVVNGWNFQENNEAADANMAAVMIQGGLYHVISNCTIPSNVAGKSLIEKTATDYNTIFGNNLFQGASIIGVNSQVFRNRAFRTENVGEVDMLAAATTVTVTHGLALTPVLGFISVTPKTGIGSAKSWWIANATSTTFDIVVDTAPGVKIGFCWNISMCKLQ